MTEDELKKTLYRAVKLTRLALGGAVLGVAATGSLVQYFGLHSHATSQLAGAAVGTILAIIALKLSHVTQII